MIVKQRLTDVLEFEVRQFFDDTRRRHAVGDEIDDVGDADAKTLDGSAPGEDVRRVRDSVEPARGDIRTQRECVDEWMEQKSGIRSSCRMTGHRGASRLAASRLARGTRRSPA